jgi:uncharacterized repeat protein (TIGR02543 family)
MKTFASRMAALLLAAAASMSAGAVTVFDNLASTPETWRIIYTSQWNTNLWVANRIPIGPESLRIDRVSMDLLEFDRFELQVCETSADATTPFMGACAAFTPDAATPGRRVFTGSRIVEADNHVWVVMRSMGWSQIRFQVTNVTKDGVAWDIGTNHGTVWKASPDTSLGMAINGESVSQDGACGSAHGNTPLRFPPEPSTQCSVGTSDGVWAEDDRFDWRCMGEYGGNPQQCSAPRAFFVTTQATGGGAIDAGREVRVGQQASFHLTTPPGYTASASGCGGALSGNVFTTAAIHGPCTVTATFTPPPTHGACGDTAPSLARPAHLCSAGQAANTSDGADAFRWQCAGLHGGNTATCVAPRQYAVTWDMDTGIATAQCSPNPVTYGSSTTCTATALDPAIRPFSGWSGACSGTGPCAPTVTGATHVSAHTAFNTHAIATSAVNGAITCTPSPVAHGSSATCIPVPATGYHFTGWAGDCLGIGACQLTNVTGPRSVSASFALNVYAIATHAANGTVTCTPNPVTHGQNAACTATANDNFHFTGWSGDCSGMGECTLANVTAPRNVTAHFALNIYFSILTPPVTGGQVRCTPSPVLQGHSATCTATPDAGYDFTGWTGDCAGTQATCTLAHVNDQRSVSGTFALKTYAIATSADHGSVVCTPNPVPHGQYAQCNPVADADYRFTGWAGDCAGSGACTLWDVTGPRSVSASFALNTYAITTHASNGTVACTPNPVTHGQDAHCTAMADSGYHFTEWAGDCSGSGACALAHVTAARSVSATFVRDPIDATCGAAANAPAVTAPSVHLCATGVPGGVLSANGQYGWECAGEHGGTAQQCSAPWANAGTGTGMVQVHGGWQITSAAFTATLPAPLPPDAHTAHAPLALVLDGGNGPAQVTVSFTEPAPAGAVYLKYGPSREGLGCTGSTACAQPHWYALPGAVFSADRTQVTLTLTDGGDGDSDGAADGRITDPGLPVLLAARHGAQPIPTLSTWALALLAAALALLAGRRKHHF